MTQSTAHQTPLPALASSPPNDKPIDWHIGLENSLDEWAQRIVMTPNELRLRVASAIRTRGHEAIMGYFGFLVRWITSSANSAARGA